MFCGIDKNRNRNSAHIQTEIKTERAAERLVINGLGTVGTSGLSPRVNALEYGRAAAEPAEDTTGSCGSWSRDDERAKIAEVFRRESRYLSVSRREAVRADLAR